MKKFEQTLEFIANTILDHNANFSEKPNYTNRDFMNTLIIFENALMDKLYDLQNSDNMLIDDRMKMAEKCGTDLRNLIKTYTGLDTYKFEDFL